MLEMHSQQRVAHSQIVTLQKELRELRGHVAKTDATNARLPQPMELQAAMTLASEQLGEWSERTERLEARVQTDAAQVASELDGKAEKRLLFGKADKAYCENLLARFKELADLPGNKKSLVHNRTSRFQILSNRNALPVDSS